MKKYLLLTTVSVLAFGLLFVWADQSTVVNKSANEKLLKEQKAIIPLTIANPQEVSAKKLEKQTHVDKIRKKNTATSDVLNRSVKNIPSEPGLILATGDDCYDPIFVDVGMMGYFTSDSTCGRGNNYDTTCLGSYDDGEDIIYELYNSYGSDLLISIDMYTTATNTGMLITDQCPPGATCIDYGTNSSSGGVTLYSIYIPSGGVFYLMIDSSPLPNCISAFDLNINLEGEILENDFCEYATSIGDGYYEAFTSFATTDGIGTHSINNDIWYCYTAPVSGVATAELCYSDFDTKIAVWDGCTCPPTVELAYNDDSAECGGGSLQSYVTFPIVLGNTYLIQSGAYSFNYGYQVLSVSSEACAPPANDECIDAEFIPGPEPVSGTGTTFCAGSDCTGWNNVWYEIALPYLWNNITIQMCPTTENATYTAVYLVTDCVCSHYIEADSYVWPDTCSGVYDGVTMYFSNVYGGSGSILWPAWIIGASGGIPFDYYVFADSSLTPPPTGDVCIDPFIVTFDTFGTYSDIQYTCDFNDDINYGGEDIVYEMTLDDTYATTISLCNSPNTAYDTYLLLYPDGDCGGTDILNDDDYCVSPSYGVSEMFDTLDAGTYYIVVDGYTGQCDTSVLEITLTPADTAYQYLPGDINMYYGAWPPIVHSLDLNYIVEYFRVNPMAISCLIDGFWASADVNGDCLIMGTDATRFVNYFRSDASLEYCPDYTPAWLTYEDLPPSAPSGWPNCETPPLANNDNIIPQETAMPLLE